MDNKEFEKRISILENSEKLRQEQQRNFIVSMISVIEMIVDEFCIVNEDEIKDKLLAIKKIKGVSIEENQ